MVMMVVVVLVARAVSDNFVVEAIAFVNLHVRDVNVVMMVVVANLVENVLPLKLVQMVCALEQRHVIVQEDFAEMTEMEEIVVHVQQVKDVVQVFANVITIVKKEIVETVFKLKEQIQLFALLAHVEHVHLALHVEPMVDVLLSSNVLSHLQLLIVRVEERLELQVQ